MVFGRDFYLKSGQLVTPYAGLGYRYLNDDSSGRISSFGDLGYERESNYSYYPLGVEFGAPLSQKWKMGMNVEYDIFRHGTQKSHFGGSLGTISNDQQSGYGMRGSLKFLMKSKSFDIAIEPFVRSWDIKDSDSAFSRFGSLILRIYEPKNETLEAGCKVALLF